MRSANSGFTYVGLLIFIAILGIAAAATVSLGSLVQRRQAEDELLTIGLTFRQALISYYQSTPTGQPRYPTRLEDLLKDPRYPNTRRHLRQIPHDPFTGKAEWGVVKMQNIIVGIHSLSSSTPIKVGLFPTELASFESKTRYSEWVFGYAPELMSPAALPKATSQGSLSGWQ